MMQFYREYNQELTMVKSIAQPPVAQLNDNTAELHKIAITQRLVTQLPGQALPNDLRSSLPSIEEIEAELDNQMNQL